MINSIDTRAVASRLMATPSLPAPDAKPVDAQNSFGQWLERSLEEVNDLQQAADGAAQQLISGENKDVHGTMIAMQKASINFNLVMQIRNKVIDAYEEVKRMQF